MPSLLLEVATFFIEFHPRCRTKIEIMGLNSLTPLSMNATASICTKLRLGDNFS
jgi:hypothetical protein